eukprot:jgi/Hompol1/4557/HPOL_000113-RA
MKLLHAALYVMLSITFGSAAVLPDVKQNMLVERAGSADDWEDLTPPKSGADGTHRTRTFWRRLSLDLSIGNAQPKNAEQDDSSDGGDNLSSQGHPTNDRP